MEAELLHEASYFAKSSKGCSAALEFSDPNTHEAVHPPLGCELHHMENRIQLSVYPPRGTILPVLGVSKCLSAHHSLRTGGIACIWDTWIREGS